jgi:hypothetical protein
MCLEPKLWMHKHRSTHINCLTWLVPTCISVLSSDVQLVVMVPASHGPVGWQHIILDLTTTGGVLCLQVPQAQHQQPL